MEDHESPPPDRALILMVWQPGWVARLAEVNVGVQVVLELEIVVEGCFVSIRAELEVVVRLWEDSEKELLWVCNSPDESH